MLQRVNFHADICFMLMYSWTNALRYFACSNHQTMKPSDMYVIFLSADNIVRQKLIVSHRKFYFCHSTNWLTEIFKRLKTCRQNQLTD